MESLAGGTALIASVIALIAALAVVGVLKGQLKQAAHQSAASNYIKEGSFKLQARSDHFLYETKTRRKIETNNNKKN